MRAIAMLEGQACNCMDSKGQPVAGTKRKIDYLCVRCDLLELLTGEPVRIR